MTLPSTPIRPESNEATINYAQTLSADAELWRWEPPTVLDLEPADTEGEWRAPNYGPGWEDSAGDPRPKFFRGQYTLRPTSYRVPDEMTGVHAFPQWHPPDAHVGYQTPWGVLLPNDRDVTQGTRVPWDWGLSGPVVTDESFVV